MKKSLFILVAGILLSVGAYACLYLARTAELRAAARTEAPELAWLKQEFRLTDEEFAPIRELHQQYLPECDEMCGKIAGANRELEALIISTNQLTPQIEEKLAEIGRIRQECQTRMLKHFYAVSRTMPEEKARRYMARMQKLTSLSNMGHASDPPNTAPPVHAH